MFPESLGERGYNTHIARSVDIQQSTGKPKKRSEYALYEGANKKDFKDKVAVITGAGRGIGRGIAERCVQNIIL